MRVIGAAQVDRLLPMADCIAVLRRALLGLAEGRGHQYLRTVQPLPQGLLAFMPAALDARYFGAKLISVFHQNAGAEHPSHQGSVLLYDAQYGTPLAAVDGGAITRIRTGAASGVATDLLARPGARHAAFLGAGTQAYAHLEALMLVRPIDTVTVYDLCSESADRFAMEARRLYGIEARTAPDPHRAVQGADIISTLTMATRPLIALRDVRPGVHINAVGACAAADRELASDLVAAARVFGDSRESVLAESGDFLIPLAENCFAEDHLLGAVGDLLAQRAAGRLSPDDITVFIALGLAIEDVAAAAYVYEKACAQQA